MDLPISRRYYLAVALFCLAASLSQASATTHPRTQTAPAVVSRPSLSGGFNQPGNILIADQFNNRAIEIDRTHNVVWQFGDGSNAPGPHSIVGLNDAERIGPFTLLSGTGVPASTPPFEPGCTNGCVDNRVIIVDPFGNIIWQYGQAGVTGSGFNQLNVPVQATFLPNGHVLITDQSNERVIEVDVFHLIVWQYGHTGQAGSGPDELNNPNSAELLSNGDVLIADENNNRVIEVDRNHHIVWKYGSPKDTSKLNGAAFASRLPSGNTLITDSNNNRIVEIDANKNVQWTFATNARPGTVANPLPTRAVRLRSGATLISDQFNDQVIAVHRVLPSGGHIFFHQGTIGVAGSAFDQLNAPYDAKVIGDYTGLTPPFGQRASDAVIRF